MNLTPIIKNSFSQYAGAVLQSRALVDARDCLKPSARQIFYCLYTDNFVHSKPYKKTLKAIGSAFRCYIHGDSSAEGIIMRAGQPFAMRYPLIEIEGSYGNLMESGNWSAPRYTSARLSELSEYLFKDIKKDTISEWRDNYDDTEQYPVVLPSKGFYNIVNGTYGIGVAASASIPQYNLKEVNAALIKLLWNENIDFDEIYCAPDFATGGFLLNGKEVKESHLNGNGKACKLRSKIEYSDKEKALIVTEIPYMVYTNTICRQLEEIINGEDNPGIDRFNDLTGVTPLIKIYLNKKANVNKVLNYLYKNTSLQTHYSINFTILENGRFPKIYNWKELLLSYLKHQMIVYTKSLKYDLNKIENRLHIIDGILKILNDIDTAINIIKTSDNTKEAKNKLKDKFNLSDKQVEAILNIKLARIVKLEVNKFIKEKDQLMKEYSHIKQILSDDNLLKKLIEKDLKKVSDKFGDDRRTKVINIKENEETLDEQVIVSITNYNNIIITKNSDILLQRRRTKGKKVELIDGEEIVYSIDTTLKQGVLIFTDKGKGYYIDIKDCSLDTKIHIETIINIQHNEKIQAVSALYNKPYIIFITKNGYLKKSLLSDYKIKRKNGIKAIELNNGDEIKSINFINEDKLGILTKDGHLLYIKTNDIKPVGRVAKGIKGIKLDNNNEVVAMYPIKDSCSEFVVITANGYGKKFEKKLISIYNKNTKGKRIIKFKELDDYCVDFLPINNKDTYITINTQNKNNKIKLTELNNLSLAAQGYSLINIQEDKVIKICKS